MNPSLCPVIPDFETIKTAKRIPIIGRIHWLQIIIYEIRKYSIKTVPLLLIL